MSNSKKKIHTELRNLLSTRFNIIKSSLGIQNDAEVIRYLIQYYYRKNHLKKEDIIKSKSIESDKELINKVMEKYGEAIKKLGEE